MAINLAQDWALVNYGGRSKHFSGDILLMQGSTFLGMFRAFMLHKVLELLIVQLLRYLGVIWRHDNWLRHAISLLANSDRPMANLMVRRGMLALLRDSQRLVDALCHGLELSFSQAKVLGVSVLARDGLDLFDGFVVDLVRGFAEQLRVLPQVVRDNHLLEQMLLDLQARRNHVVL